LLRSNGQNVDAAVDVILLKDYPRDWLSEDEMKRFEEKYNNV
jgi:hypothetical protein